MRRPARLMPIASIRRVVRLSVALAACCIAPAHAEDANAVSQRELERVLAGEHTCVGFLVDAGGAEVHCEVGHGPRIAYRDYKVSVRWMSARFSPAENGVWISGGRDGQARAIPANR